jgi:hypothetical protein
MSEERREATISVPIGYRTTRLVFLAGLLLDLILWFVPAYRMMVGGVLGFGGEWRSLSALDVTRLNFQRGQAGWGFLDVAFFAATAVVLFLAWKQPKRWVFVAGASIFAFGLLLEFFMGSSESVQRYFLPRLLYYLAALAALTGFWIKPPVGGEAPSVSKPS